MTSFAPVETKAVREALKTFDAENDLQSFCGQARPVGDYYVVPVIQLPKLLFQQFSPLVIPPSTDDDCRPAGEKSLIHSCIDILSEEASKELLTEEPGRSINGSMRKATEIVLEAAARFMRVPDYLTGDLYSSDDLFQRLNIISSLFYEGTKGKGRLILVKPDSNEMEYLLRFAAPVSFREPRWARKILQMATTEVAVIASGGKIYGLGKLKNTHDPKALDAFTVNFLDHYQWELCCGNQVMMYSRYREPRLPQEPISRTEFCSNYQRLFPNASAEDYDRSWQLFTAAVNQPHGCMILLRRMPKENLIVWPNKEHA